MASTNDADQFPALHRPDHKTADRGNVRLGDGFITDEFPPLHRPTKKVVDSGKVRLGDGFITDEFPA